MPAEDAPARRELCAHRLRHAENDAADERAPERAEAADDHGLEGEQKTVRTAAEGERRADTEEDSCDGDDAERQPHGEAVHATGVDAHERGRAAVVGGGAERAPDRGPTDQE